MDAEYIKYLDDTPYPSKVPDLAENPTGHWCTRRVDLRRNKHKLLQQGAREGRYIFTHHEHYDVILYPDEEYIDMPEDIRKVSRLDTREMIYISRGLKAGIPYIGTLLVMTSPSMGHAMTFLIQPKSANDAEYPITLFETYDTSKKHFESTDYWAKAVALALNLGFRGTVRVSVSTDVRRAIVASGETIDLQKNESKENQKCVMWSLVFASYLSKLPNLSTAGAIEFKEMYRTLEEKIKSPSEETGYEKDVAKTLYAGRRRRRKSRRSTRRRPRTRRA